MDWTTMITVVGGFLSIVFSGLTGWLTARAQTRAAIATAAALAEETTATAKRLAEETAQNGWQKLVADVRADRADIYIRLADSEKKTAECEEKHDITAAENAQLKGRVSYLEAINGVPPPKVNP